MDELIYNKTTTKEGNDCLITKNAHIVEVKDNWSSIYIVTVSTLFEGWMGFDSRTESYVYSNESEAKAFCDGFMGE